MTDQTAPAAAAPIVAFDLAALVAQITEAQAQFKAWETRKKALLDQLSAAHRDGLIASKFDFRLPDKTKPAKFSLQNGRKTVHLPPVLKAEIDLLTAKALEDGTATTTYGASFWRITEAS